MKAKRWQTQIKLFLRNIFTSGKHKDQKNFDTSDYLIRYVLLNFISIFGGAMLTAFIVIRFMEGKYGTVIACSAMFFICFLTVLFSRLKKMPQIVPAILLMSFYGALCVMITWLGEAEGSNFLFIYMYPLTAIMLLGMKFGVIFSVFFLIIVSLQMFFPNLSFLFITRLSMYDYKFTVPMHMLATYSLVFSVMITIEITRKTKDRMIEIQNQRMMELKEEAEAASRTKSSFLANMSHEIRTPMNAITGMSELLLRRDLTEDARGEVQDIKQAAANLISIINSILDFSKIEAGKLEIFPGNYMLSSLINDTVNIIRMRLMEKPVRFFTNIDGSIPNNLIGDEVRLRQIIINLLSNAAKFTEKGHVSLSITRHNEKHEDKIIWLKISICDTGQGMKPEDQAKLFSDYAQVNTKKNRAIEGTGLGLQITKGLCDIMGGSINITSEYGKGSVFTVIIPQEIGSDTPFAMVENPEQKKVLVYEGRLVYAKSVSWSLENMGIPHTVVTNQAEFSEALCREKWYYIFSGYGLYERIKSVIANTVFPDGEKPPLALMVEWGIEILIPHVRFISLPAQSLSIANTLNGKTDKHDYFDNSAAVNAIRFTIPKSRILVVDDLPTNLKVAEGLLAPYKAQVDTCLSGIESIKLVQQRNYDLVFMDHMMPEMDGIETTAIIRELEDEHIKNMPIIALTANAIIGMKEMFLDKGFNDFLAKPIDVSKLDEMLDRWIPKEKRKWDTEKQLVLLVDSNRTNLKMGMSALEENYDVATAPSIEKMHKLLEKNNPALILMNADMAENDAADSPSQTINDIPVLYITGPFDPSTFIDCVENFF